MAMASTNGSFQRLPSDFHKQAVGAGHVHVPLAGEGFPTFGVDDRVRRCVRREVSQGLADKVGDEPWIAS